jgi:hypothetical protein
VASTTAPSRPRGCRARSRSRCRDARIPVPLLDAPRAGHLTLEPALPMRALAAVQARNRHECNRRRRDDDPPIRAPRAALGHFQLSPSLDDSVEASFSAHAASRIANISSFVYRRPAKTTRPVRVVRTRALRSDAWSRRCSRHVKAPSRRVPKPACVLAPHFFRKRKKRDGMRNGYDNVIAGTTGSARQHIRMTVEYSTGLLGSSPGIVAAFACFLILFCARATRLPPIQI